MKQNGIHYKHPQRITTQTNGDPMKIYENKDSKREISCGYCFNEGHNKRHCPHMKAQWLANPQVHETYDHDSLTGVDTSMFPSRYQNYWGDSDAKRQFRSHWRYMQKRFAPKDETKPKKRRKAKCGFCGSTAHNRRNCNKLKNFIYVLNETNKAYRSQFYDKFIDGMGLGAGALLSIRGWDGLQKVAIATTFPTQDIMFTNLLRTWSDYHSRAKMTALVGGDDFSFNLGADWLYAEDPWNDELGVWKPMYSNWARVHSIVSPAPNKPSKEWFMGQAPCFDWVVKKRDINALMHDMVFLIKHFYPHNNLRSKLGAKVYDRYYGK